MSDQAGQNELSSTEIEALITCAVFVLDKHYRRMEEPNVKSKWEQERLESALQKLERLRRQKVVDEFKRSFSE